MKIKAITVNRLRGYSTPVKVEVDDLLVLVGRNDIGKSTLLEAGLKSQVHHVDEIA